jgi:SAM-dependent methyltransferase
MGHYDPSIFCKVRSLEQAKAIILTHEEVLTSEQRWQLETPHICDLIAQQLRITGQSLVVDYGCGVGRIARELIERHACRVIGIDIAANMRALAASYVASDRFFACAPNVLDELPINADLVLAIWTLQHVASLCVELKRVRGLLSLKCGPLFVVNERTNRLVPTNRGWLNDGIDVRGELSKKFSQIAWGNLDPDVVGLAQSERTFWATYKG